MLVKVLTLYPDLSAEWLMRGEGDMIKDAATDNPSCTPNNPNESGASSSENIPHAILDKFLTTIQEQAEEIGQLRERIAQLQREKGKNASDAQTSGIANVG